MPLCLRWPLWLRITKPTPRSEVMTMLIHAEQLQSQLKETEIGLASFIARAERVAALLESRGDNVDEL